MNIEGDCSNMKEEIKKTETMEGYILKIQRDVDKKMEAQTREIANLSAQIQALLLNQPRANPNVAPNEAREQQIVQGAEAHNEQQGWDPYDYEEEPRNQMRAHHRGGRGRGRGFQVQRPNREFPLARDDDLKGIKFKIPPFQGKTDPEEYLQWEAQTEHIFDCNNFSEQRKVLLAITEFTNYASVWWIQLKAKLIKERQPQIETWAELKGMMRKRFIPTTYERDIVFKLQRFDQGSKSVEDYYKELDILMTRAGIEETELATMGRFMGGLNRELRHKVDAHSCYDMEEMLHLAIKFESHMQEDSKSRYYSKPYSSKPTSSKPTSSQPWGKDTKNTYSGRGDQFPKDKPIFDKKREGESSFKGKGKIEEARTRDIKCWKCQGLGHVMKDCPNKRTMFIENGEYISGDDESEHENMEFEEESDGSVEEGNKVTLVSRRVLSAQVKENDQDQRENLFYTRCYVEGVPCSVIIDGGSCTNAVSSTLVTRLNLTTKPHPKPYKLQWLTDCGELKVNKKTLISMTLGKYKDEVECDVVPMHAGDILLGRPWQFDRRAIHDGYLNRYSFTLNGRKTTLTPLTSSEVYIDQCKLEKRRKELESEKKKLSDSKELSDKKKLSDSKKLSDKKKLSDSKDLSDKNTLSEKREQKKGVSLFARTSEVKRALFSNKTILVLLCKGSCFITNQLNQELPSVFVDLLQQYGDVFPEEMPNELPPIRGIEHKIDFIPGASIPNRPAYRSNPTEENEIHK